MWRTINQFDEQGRKHGYWEEPDGDGKIRQSGTYDHGVKVGVWYTHNRNGNKFPQQDLKEE